MTARVCYMTKVMNLIGKIKRIALPAKVARAWCYGVAAYVLLVRATPRYRLLERDAPSQERIWGTSPRATLAGIGSRAEEGIAY